VDSTRRIVEPPRPADPRSQFRLDRDRILYSAHFARLAEITQVVSPDRGYVFHNRLTHSIKVAQIARTIAEKFNSRHARECESLGGIDPDAAEAAGLAHDLGHPPFGHVGEEELNALVRRAGVPDGFEGNAQSFRVVCSLAVGDAWREAESTGEPIPGLNLTRSTLGGLVKYPWSFGENPDKPKKWGFYEEERGHFEWVRESVVGFQRTLVAEVMDWADDVTYAIHDLLDFYRAGLIPLELVRSHDSLHASVERVTLLEGMYSRRPDWNERRRDYEAALDAVLEVFPFDVTHRYSAAESDEQRLYAFATVLISRFVNAIAPADPSSSALATVGEDVRAQVDVLKEFVWAYVILNPDMELLHRGQRRAIRCVFSESLRAARKQAAHFFPGPFRQRLADCVTDRQAVRLVADHVAGMTEHELMRTYQRLMGIACD